jgi:hypothetical protein
MLFKDMKNAEEAFLYFINNSTFNFYLGGNNGITIIAKLNKNVQSCYKYINCYNFNENVNQLLLKIVLIKNNKYNKVSNQKSKKNNNNEKDNNEKDNDEKDNDEKDNDEDEDYSSYIFKFDSNISTNNKELDLASKEEFIHEVNTQVDIYLKSMKYLQPICPPICYAKVYEYNPENKLFFHKILKDNLNLLKIYIRYGIDFDSIGLIAMEYAQDFHQLFHLIKHKHYNIYKNMSRYLLLRLAVETGYNHSDFHKYNILINKNNNQYFDNLDGYPLLIDFSWTQKIPLDTLNIIKEKYKNKQYVEALDILYKMKRRDDINLEEHDVFNWLTKNIYFYSNISKIQKTCQNEEQIDAADPVGYARIIQLQKESDTIISIHSVNQEIDNLINFRNINIENMKKKSSLIPLNNSVKKHMFLGILL